MLCTNKRYNLLFAREIFSRDVISTFSCNKKCIIYRAGRSNGHKRRNFTEENYVLRRNQCDANADPDRGFPKLFADRDLFGFGPKFLGPVLAN